MTNREKIIVSAYTGFLMCDFSDMHEYIEAKFGRPVFTHEMASEEFQKELKERTREDFMAICEETDVPDINDGDMISRQLAIDCMDKVIMFRMKPELKDRVATYLKSVPPVQSERKTGQWMEITEGDCSGYDPVLAGYDDPVVGYVCSCCGDGHEKETMGEKLWNFCPNCGSYNGGDLNE